LKSHKQQDWDLEKYADGAEPEVDLKNYRHLEMVVREQLSLQLLDSQEHQKWLVKDFEHDQT
jgi:hypothetical protein